MIWGTVVLRHRLSDSLMRKQEEVLERIAGLEEERPVGYSGGVRQPSRGVRLSSVMESKVVSSLSKLTDDRTAFRQRDLKLINALNHTQRGYGRVIDRLKECIDRAQDLEDVDALDRVSYFHELRALVDRAQVSCTRTSTCALLAWICVVVRLL